MKTVLRVTKDLKTGPKTYQYPTIGGIPANQYLREKKRERYHRIKETPELSPVEQLSLDTELVHAIRNLRMQQQSYRAMERHLGVSRYLIRRLCELHNID